MTAFRLLVCLAALCSSLTRTDDAREFTMAHFRRAMVDFNFWATLTYEVKSGVRSRIVCGAACAKRVGDCWAFAWSPRHLDCRLVSALPGPGNSTEKEEEEIWSTAYIKSIPGSLLEPSPILVGNLDAPPAHDIHQVLIRSDCDDTKGYWTAGGPDPAFLVVDLGGEFVVKKFILRATRHFPWGDHCTKEFSIAMSNKYPISNEDNAWRHVFRAELLNAWNMDPCKIPYQEFEYLAHGRYVQMGHYSGYDVQNFGFKYIGFEVMKF